LAISDETLESKWVVKDKVLDLVTAPAIITRYQAYLDFEGKVNYMEYVTKPQFEVKVTRKI
jgi:hypothetical protein